MSAPTARRMTCRELIEFLAAYVENELVADERAVFDRHLSVCPDCVNYLASYRESIRLAKRSFAPESAIAEQAPEELIDAILAARPRS